MKQLVWTLHCPVGPLWVPFGPLVACVILKSRLMILTLLCIAWCACACACACMCMCMCTAEHYGRLVRSVLVFTVYCVYHGGQ